jgi:hypothetical protein
MVELETMTLAELKILVETAEEIRRKRLSDELAKREEKIQALLDECFELIEESELNVYADTAHENYTERFDLSEILTFEFDDEE